MPRRPPPPQPFPSCPGQRKPRIRDSLTPCTSPARMQFSAHAPSSGADACGCTLCDLGILADQAAEPVPPQDPDICTQSRRMRPPGRRALLQRPMRPMGVVVIDVLPENEPEMPLTRDQHPVQALAACAGDPPFGDGVRARHAHRRLDDPHAGCGEHSVERAANLASRSRIRNFRPPT